MQMSTWRRRIGRWLGRPVTQSAAAGPRTRLDVELLENRLAPATLTWVGLSGSNWSTGANWTGGTGAAPVNGDILRFDTTGFTGSFTSNNDLVGLALSGLQIVDSSAAGDFSITGNAINLFGTLSHNLTVGTASSLSVAGITLATSMALSNANGALTIGSGITMGSFNLTATAATAAVNPLVTVNGNVSGTGALNLDSGGMQVNGNLTVNNLRVGFKDIVTPESTVASLTVGAGSVVSIGSNNTHTLTIGERTGGTTGTSPVTGTLDLGLAASVAINVNTLHMGRVPSGANTGDADVVGHLFLSQAGANNVTASTIVMGDSSGPGNTNVTSTMTLGAGLNTFRADNFNIGVAKSLAQVTIAAGGTLDLANRAGSGGANVRLGDNASPGTSTIGTGLLDLTAATFNANIAALVLGRYPNSGTGSTGAGSGTLIMSAGSVTATNVLLAQAGNSTNAAGDNTGVLALNGGSFTISGTLTMSQGRGVSTVNVNGATLNVATISTVPGSGGSATINLDSGALHVVTASMAPGGSGSATINLNGGTLSAQTISGSGANNLNWNDGIFRNRAGQSLSVANVNVNILGAGTHTFLVDPTRTATLQTTGILTGDGTLTKTDTGTLVLAAANTYTGTLDVNAGTLQVNGSIATSANAVNVANGATLGGTGNIVRAVSVSSGGIVAPGTTGAGILTVNSIVFASGSIFQVTLNGVTAGTQHDQLRVTNTANLGNATLTLVGGFAPPATFNLLLIDPGILLGTFNGFAEASTVTVGAFTGVLSYQLHKVRIHPVNQAPVINPQTFPVSESSANGTVVGTVAASDPNSHTLTYAITAGDPDGIFAINGSTGEITVADNTLLDADVAPVYSLTVQVTDNGIPTLSSSATITINVIETNLPPDITNQSFTLDENSANGTTVGTVVASDPNAGQTISYSIIGGNVGLAFAIDSGSGVITVATSSAINYETNPVFNLTVQVTDNGFPTNLSSSATITISLNNINEPPVANGASLSTPYLTPLNIDLWTLVSDPDTPDSSLTFTVGSPVNGTATLQPDGHTVQFSGASVGPASFTYTVNDGTTTVGPRTVQVDIVPVLPAPPVASDNLYNTDEDTGVMGNVITDNTGAGIDTDPNPDVLTVTAINGQSAQVGVLVILASGGRLTVQSDGSFEYMPGSQMDQLKVGETATESFTYTLGDGTGRFDVATVTLFLTGVNDQPLGPTAKSFRGLRGLPIKMSVAKLLGGFTDAEQEPMQVELVDQPAKGTVTQAADGKLVYKGPKKFVGKVTFTYRVKDPHDAFSAVVTVTLRIVPGRQTNR